MKRSTAYYIFWLFSLSLALSTPSRAVTEISQFGITWKFAQNVQMGQYANGDYWVVGPVTITEILPASAIIDGRTINGSMINPKAQEGGSQGFDSAMYAQYGPAYDASLNVARPNGNSLSANNPLIVPANSSLVSTISHPTAGNRPQLTDAAILTVVNSAPPSGSFRPPYQGADKTHRWSKQNLNYSILKSLPPPAGALGLSTLTQYYERPWLEINTSWLGRYMHPTNNQPDYGRDMAIRLGHGLIALHLNYSNPEKEKLYIQLVQYGLDIYGAARDGARWRDLGGHNQGRKMPLVLAALALNDADLARFADASQNLIFQEDRQTWIVTQSDVGRVLYTADGRRRDPYVQQDVGVAEWGEQHTSQSNRDGRNWDTYYRDIAGSSVVAHALVAHLTPGAKEMWKWEPFFLYMDRFFNIEKDRVSGANIIPSYHRTAWLSFRDTVTTAASTTPPRDARIQIQSSN